MTGFDQRVGSGIDIGIYLYLLSSREKGEAMERTNNHCLSVMNLNFAGRFIYSIRYLVLDIYLLNCGNHYFYFPSEKIAAQSG